MEMPLRGAPSNLSPIKITPRLYKTNPMIELPINIIDN